MAEDKNKEFYKELLEATVDGLWELDLNGRYKYVNNGLCRILGYAEKELLGKPYYKFMDIKEAFRYFNDILPFIQSPKAFHNVINVMKHKNGREVILESSGYPCYNEKGRLIGYRGTDRDITAKLVTEKKLHSSKERFTQLVENISDLVCELDSNFNFLYCNDNYEKILGFTSEELKGTSLFNLLHPEDQNDQKKPFNNLIKGKKETEIQWRLKDKKGEWLWFSNNWNIFKNEREELSTVLVSREITSWKMLEKARSALLELNRFSESNAEDSLIRQGLSLAEDLTKSAFSRFHYLDSHGGIEKTITAEQGSPLSPNVMPFLENAKPEDLLKECYESKKPVFRNDVDDSCSEREVCVPVIENGTVLAILQILGKQFPYRGYDLETLHEIVMNLWSLISRKQTEEQLKRSNLALKEAKEKAEEADRLKSAFLANMSHEIRTPMNSIMGFAKLMQSPDKSADDKEKYAEIIQNGSEKLLRIINDILDISKIEAGQLDIITNEINLNLFLEDIRRFYERKAQEQNIRFEIHPGLTDEEAIVWSDEIRLNQVLTNLITNAFKYTRNGQVIIDYQLHEDNYELEFHVMDTGTGIDENSKEIIFERFRQAATPISGIKEGTGLGLAIARGIVTLLGGRIWLERSDKGGTLFCFTIPFYPVLGSA